MDGVAGTVDVKDNATPPNIYTMDKDVTNDSSIRTLIFSTRVTTALNGNVITITPPSSVNMAATFFSFNGLASPAPDQFSTGFGTGTSLTVGPTSTTSQPDDVLIAAMGI